MEDLYNDKTVIRNFIQGNLWNEQRKKFIGKFVIPLFVFIDDFEPGNSLGSHSGCNKIGPAYVSIPCIPPKYYSQLKYIFPVLIAYSDDKKKFGNQMVFQKLINELNHLHDDGIKIKIGDTEQTIYFQLSLILGDNLGLNGILGFTEF